MSSYYNRIIGTLSPSEVARSEDIHLIQSSIQTAFQEMITDLFGIGCILGQDEESLKLIPTPYTIDQSNNNYSEENPWISFFDIYLRQEIEIHKSEIQAMRVTIRNTTNLMPTVFAEIRDSDFNLIKETNVKLPAQTEDAGEEIDFIFNLQHLPLGQYYFVIRPVDINSADLTANGDETQYDTITEDSFQILCDRNGNYNQGLHASYNGVDYLESRLLESELKSVTTDGFIETEDENFDLCFEHLFSSGNTYIIQNIAPCIVMGEKIYPIDTHVSIDGPSPSGNRIDLVSLSTNGQLEVTKGNPFVGTATEENYPINNTGLKIAYITTYFGSDSEWYCSNCGTKNNSNIVECTNCGATTNVKTPLIEQKDDDGITRRRDILERLRRLEKKLDYQVEYNSPSRIKYNCTVDPTLNVSKYDTAEGTYAMTTIKNDAGEDIVVATGDKSTKDYLWSIVDASYTYDTGSSMTVTVSCKDVHIPKTKPKNVNKSKHYINITAKDNSSKPKIMQVGNLKITIKNSKGKAVKTLTKQINSESTITIDPWSFKLKAGTYKIVVTYGSSKSITATLKIYGTSKFNATPKNHSMKITVLDGTLKENKIKLGNTTMTGDDSFYKDNITVDTEKGEVYLKKVNNSDQTKTSFPTQSVTGLNYSYHTYKINTNKKSLQSEYPMLNITLERDCYLESIVFNVSGTNNLKYMRALLFKNDRVFNLNTSRKSYRKYLRYNDAKDTAFPNIKLSDEIKVQANGKYFKYTMPVNKKIEKGTYSLLLYGILKDKKKDGYIKLKEYHTAKATQYGALSRVKGTSSPNQIFMEGENLTNKTMYVKFNKIDDVHNTTGTIISKTIDTVDNIISCKLSHYYDIPNGCYVHTYVSNNGGKTYVEQVNNKGTVTFNGVGHELKWRLVFTGSGAKTPKLKFNKKNLYAFKITTTTGKMIAQYEDYDRCFATPLLNANAITRTLASNQNIKNHFSEWEYARLWMEDEDLQADIDICFAYAYDNYTDAVGTSMNNWNNDIFFSQVFSSLNADDFSKNSVDYDNYNAAVEYDELNFRFNLQTDYMYNYTRTGEIAATPKGTYDGSNVGKYTYGDITNEDMDMSMFKYGLMEVETVYNDSTDSNNDISLAYSSYYQAMYVPNSEASIDSENEDHTTTLAWAKDSDPEFNPDACIVGVSFTNGVEIKEQYTSLTVGIFPNLRDCDESDEDTGQLSIVNGEVHRKGTEITSKYYNDNGEAYIPGNTLELVIALNPYGLVDENNATYGQVIPITKDLISCMYQEVSIDLSDLYNATVYSIGLRVNENASYDGDRHPSLQSGDIIGIGNVVFGGYNIKPYTPYVQNDTSAKRLQWQAELGCNQSTAYVQNRISNGTYKGQYVQSYLAGYKNKDQNKSTKTLVYNKSGTWLELNNNVSRSEHSVIKQNNIKTNINGTDYNNVKSDSNEIVFELNGAETDRYLFRINTDLNLTPYDYVNVQYYIEQDKGSTSSVGEIHKGDITLRLYDTENITEQTAPIEELVLPAWGTVQSKAPYSKQADKTVNAWFKIRTDAKYVKCIRLYRGNPTRDTHSPGNIEQIKLHLKNILFYNAAELPALGPQMHIRIYPQSMSGVYNTKIRKFGAIYRL